jgi:uncharacterized protein (UPF0335 family)
LPPVPENILVSELPPPPLPTEETTPIIPITVPSEVEIPEVPETPQVTNAKRALEGALETYNNYKTAGSLGTLFGSNPQEFNDLKDTLAKNITAYQSLGTDPNNPILKAAQDAYETMGYISSPGEFLEKASKRAEQENNPEILRTAIAKYEDARTKWAGSRVLPKLLDKYNNYLASVAPSTGPSAQNERGEINNKITKWYQKVNNTTTQLTNIEKINELESEIKDYMNQYKNLTGEESGQVRNPQYKKALKKIEDARQALLSQGKAVYPDLGQNPVTPTPSAQPAGQTNPYANMNKEQLEKAIDTLNLKINQVFGTNYNMDELSSVCTELKQALELYEKLPNTNSIVIQAAKTNLEECPLI